MFNNWISPQRYQAEFDSLLSAALKSIINKEETLDDAVAELQIKGQRNVRTIAGNQVGAKVN
ncbi:hypothetical protein M3661_12830 [Paenibacillus sp. MER 180]|uniref:hypothetical protein n=1 Tax=unclassified Paenibacillus TaxID=185978 RepID=UPI0008064D94|nr:MULTISPECIES: hypothetical protein [unclassified Paenibacillus]MCM3291011.1 hypothetical protein [Paenibacillus sp. MER 180]OBY76320.1 hypothetical protein BBG47_27875 [Paenibacillus sp. KS1]